jgi:hypothetical protein
MTESRSFPETGERVRLLELSEFDQIELSSRSVPREEAYAALAANPLRFRIEDDAEGERE